MNCNKCNDTGIRKDYDHHSQQLVEVKCECKSFKHKPVPEFKKHVAPNTNSGIKE